eukprot:1156355-Pelagomonas_calceolata.AAC.13
MVSHGTWPATAHSQLWHTASHGTRPVMANDQPVMAHSQSWHIVSHGMQPVMAHGQPVMACSHDVFGQSWQRASQSGHMASQSWHAAMMYLASHGKGPASHTIKLKQVLKPHEQTPFFLGHDEYAPAKHPSRQPDTL